MSDIQSIDPTDPASASVLTGTLIERLGMRIVSVTAAECVATMPVAGNTQPFGLLHGGASAALAETVGSFAAQTHAVAVRPGANARAVGLELSITHHRSAREGVVTARARAQHLGRTTATYLVEVIDAEERLISSARLTCLLLSD
ncbi:PaaI family thioesterase [Salana multivorans]